jgi:MATE family multidrug resistance protein
MVETEVVERDEVAATTVRPGMQGRVLRLAWPVIGENMLQTMLGVVDTLLVARLGAAALAGVGAGLQLTFFLISALAAVTIGASVLVAHAAGARDGQTANRLARQALLWGVAISVPLSIVSVALGDPLIALFGLTPEVAHIGAGYWRIVAGGTVLLMIMLTSSAILRSLGDSRTPMLVTLLVNVINAVAAYGLIFGEWGLPALGTDGSAWASNLGRLIGAFVLVAVLVKGRGLVMLRGWVGWRPDISVGRRIFQLGIPAASEQVLTTLSFLVLTIIIATLGTEVLAAQRLAFTAMSLAFMPGFGFAIAATALVGQSLGARRPAEAAVVATIATRWAVIWMGVLAVVFFFFGAQIMRLFSADSSVIAFGADSLRVIALSQPFWAIMFVQAGALRGARNTTFPLRVNTVGMWAAVGLAWVAVEMTSLGLIGAWGAYAIVAPIMAFLLWRRFRRADWQEAGPTPGGVRVAVAPEG